MSGPLITLGKRLIEDLIGSRRPPEKKKSSNKKIMEENGKARKREGGLL